MQVAASSMAISLRCPSKNQEIGQNLETTAAISNAASEDGAALQQHAILYQIGHELSISQSRFCDEVHFQRENAAAGGCHGGGTLP
jgi:hypothetical protein